MTRLIPGLSDADRTAFLRAARSFLTSGKPDEKGRPRPARWKHMGRKATHVDCIGIPRCAFSAIGFGSYCVDLDWYSPDPDGHTLRDSLERHLGPPIPRQLWRAGDIALMRWHVTKEATWHNHVGVLTSYPHGGFALLHCLRISKFVVEHRLSGEWERRVHEVFSLTGDVS